MAGAKFKLFYQQDLAVLISCPIRTHEIVLPYLRIGVARFGFPGQIGLGTAGDQTPVIPADMMLGKDRQHGLKGIVMLPPEPLRTEDGAVILFADGNIPFQLCGR